MAIHIVVVELTIFDSIDSQLINQLQYEFPLVKKPYEELANRLNISEDEVLSRVRRLYADGVIRDIGAIFNSNMIGLVSTLVALQVSEDTIDEAARIISSYAEVTHNYEREGDYNVWFTLTAASEEALTSTLTEIRERVRPSRYLSVPAKRVFKIKTNFRA